MQNIDLNLRPDNIQELVNPNRGMTVVRPSWYPQDEMLIELMEVLPSFRSVDNTALESNYTYLCLSPESGVWAEYSRQVAVALNQSLEDATDAFGTINFDDLYLTRYTEADKDNALGVGPHRDTNCKGLVAALILKGRLPSFICEEKDLSGSISIPVEVGEIMIMRAESRTGLRKLLHYVGNIGRRSVIQFGMRQYIKPIQK